MLARRPRMSMRGALAALWALALVCALAITAAQAAPAPAAKRRLFPRHGDSAPAALPPVLNAFADGAATDSSTQCLEARTCVASWQNVTNCFGPALRLFYATPDNVCLGQCREVTVQAAAMIANACSTEVSPSSDAAPSADSSFAGFGAGGAVTERIQADIYRIWANKTAADIACTQVPAGNAARLQETSAGIASTDHVGGDPQGQSPAAPPKAYVLEVVLNAYTAWQSGFAMPGSIKSSDAALRATQCTPVVHEFWRNWVGSPAQVPQLYYWSMPESAEYMAALERICGSDFFTTADSNSASPAAAASVSAPSTTIVVGRPTVTVTLVAAATPMSGTVEPTAY